MKTLRKLETNQYIMRDGIAIVSLRPAWLYYNRQDKPRPSLFIRASALTIERKDAARILRDNRRIRMS